MECKICGFITPLSLVSHITRKHGITITEYKIQNPNSIVQIVSEKQKNKIRNTLQEYYSNDDIKKKMSDKMIKGGGSWRCVSYWIKRGYTNEQAKYEISKKQKIFGNQRGEVLPTENCLRKEYWIERHGLSENDAIIKVSNIQKERGKNSQRHLGKTHNDEQRKKISISMSKMIKNAGVDKWVSHFGDFKECFRSKGEIKLYEHVKNNIDIDAECNVFIGKYNVDIKYGNNIIEYFGDYWHCNPNKYKSDYYHKLIKMTAQEIWDKDNKKIKWLEDKGFNVKIVWENH